MLVRLTELAVHSGHDHVGACLDGKPRSVEGQVVRQGVVRGCTEVLSMEGLPLGVRADDEPARLLQ